VFDLSKKQWGSSAEGAEGRRVWGEGVLLPTGGGAWGRGCAPSAEIFLFFFISK